MRLWRGADSPLRFDGCAERQQKTLGVIDAIHGPVSSGMPAAQEPEELMVTASVLAGNTPAWIPTLAEVDVSLHGDRRIFDLA
ncbi:hypothetical protein FQ154_19300 [Paeniglutamicibacter gangotriensis]|uniref:Uncharacterized protein n=1 Tax=Paeniglutamicibacter gangotriensis TaxID=254787 RepID=A0A5B0E5N4_9MICC|nr:hypothetical protein [Paeniglutamicibacter gangotriensis]KAA0973201.1 hypothetical protein FQ154_19300 [Paeniglutamicibacter gangotriensis]